MGRETVYEFRSEQTCRVTVGLSDVSVGVDLGAFLLDRCDPSAGYQNTLDCAYGAGSVVFDAVAGRSYLVVVDGWNETEGPYTIAVDCVCGASDAG